ncbi:MAG TPA: hypothetical protein VKE42_06755 [Candidatus Cybelea sp.]|nr:hypothetical protein [Candidatus Cybelea sp.]
MAKIPKRRRIGQRVGLPKTLADFDRMRRRSQVTFQNVTHVLTRMREGASLKSAAAEYGVDPRSVVRIGKAGLHKTASGRYAAKSSDPLLRVLTVRVHGGPIEVAVPGSRKASTVSKRSNAQRHFVHTGDTSQLEALEGKTILDASGREVPFLTDLDELERQGDLGILSYESIYARR